MERRRMYREMKNMQNTNSEVCEAGSVDELYRLRSGSDEIRCHRLKMHEGTVGELLLTIAHDAGKLSIEEVFIDKRHRKHGLGNRLLHFAEETATALGLQLVGVRPFSTDPTLTDLQLHEWYSKRGYMPAGDRMLKRIKAAHLEVIS